MKKQPIKIVRGNDIVLRATCYVRNELGELEAIDLQGCDVSVSASMLQGGVTDIPYSIVDSNTLELDCKAEVFPVLGSYSIDIRIVKDEQNVRFATRAAVQIVEYSNELHEVGECCDGEYSVVSIPDQIACAGPVKYALHVGVKNGESNLGEVVDALTERVTNIEEKNAEQDEEIAGFGKQIEDLGEQIGDITLAGIKNYNTYTEYNADGTRDDRDVSFIKQDNSIWVCGNQYAMNAGCHVGSDVSGISTIGNWFLAGEATMAAGTDVHIIASLQQTLEALSKGGLFTINLRYDGGTTNTYHSIQWLTKVGSSVPKLRLVVNGASVKLYCQVYGGQYRYAHIRFYNQVARIPNESKNIFFTLANSTTIIPDADVPSGTDIADVPYLAKDGTAAQSNKVWYDFANTTNANMRVLFGRDNSNAEYDSVFKSSKLLFNPSTETLTVPTVKNPNGSYAHVAYNSRGTVGYIKVATITINKTYADEPIYFEIMQRLQPLAKLRLQYSTAGNTNPPLNTFTYQGTSVNRYYLHQTGSGVWDLYVDKFDSWTAITVSKVYIGGFSNGYYQDPYFTITWQDELVTALPEGSVAATKATEHVNIDGNANSANKLVTARKIGFAAFDGTADVSLNNMQGAFNVRWGTNTTRWQRVIRLKTNATYNCSTIILAVQDGESVSFSGILKFQARTRNTTSIVDADVKWLALSQRFGDVSKSFRVYVTPPTDTDEYVYIDLYATSAYSYVRMLFNVLSHNVSANVAYGGSGEWVEENAITGTLVSTSTYEVFDELDAIKARLAALEAKTTTES